MRPTLILCLAALIAAAPVFAADTVDAGRGDVAVHAPKGASGPLPLIVLLHGFGSSGEQQNAYFKLSSLVDAYGFVLATPDGTASKDDVFGMSKPRFWNATSACCNFLDMKVDDSAYLGKLIEKVQGKYEIDPRRIYFVGHSNGGFMSYRMARDHAGTVAAIASLAGGDDPEAPATNSAPVHVLQIHGTSDETILYGGGELQGRGGYTGAEKTVALWAQRNGCGDSTAAVGTLDLDAALDGAESKVTRHTGCRAGGSAELWAIEGGSHVPGFTDHFGPQVVEWLLARSKP